MLYIFFLSETIYIDNNKVQKKDERSFPQKQNLIEVKLDSPTKQKLYTKSTTNYLKPQKHNPTQHPESSPLTVIYPFWITNWKPTEL